MNRIATLLCIPLAIGISAGLAPGQEDTREEAEMEGAKDERFVADWENNFPLEFDMFTFARINYYGGSWKTDWPYSDVNLSYRLQQLTSLGVNREPEILYLTDEKLFDYPFVFLTKPKRNTYFSPDEGEKLREYLLNGGFMLVDDFWGRDMWNDFSSLIRETVFTGSYAREPVELSYDHPIFHTIFEMDKIPQVPSHDAWLGTPYEGTAEKTYEVKVAPWDQEYLAVPHFMAYYDDDGRMCMLVCANNDLADGWEEEGFATWFFNAFSEKYCFPMAINILFYVMTH